MTAKTNELQPFNWNLFTGAKLCGWVENADEATAIINAANQAIFKAGRDSTKANPVPVASLRLTLAGGGFRDIGFTSVHDRDVLLAFITNSGVSPAAAQQIAIVSMPDRETTSEVARDSSGNIKTATQTERDA